MPDQEEIAFKIDDVCYAAWNLMRSLADCYGKDKAYELFQQFGTTLGDDIRNRLFLLMLDGNLNQSGMCLGDFRVLPNVYEIIALIKILRDKSCNKNGIPLSLKEAKDLIDSARFTGPQRVYFYNRDKKNECRSEMVAYSGIIT